MVILVSGCLKNPFATREGPEPAGSRGTWETPATPEVVLVNLMFAYNEMNIQNYQLCFADEFIYSATEDSIEAEVQGNGHLFQFWDKSVEISTAENLFASLDAEDSNVDLILSPAADYPDSIGDSLAVLYRNYTLRIITPEDFSPDTTVIECLVSFSASRTLFSWWSIYFWKELPYPGTDISWADFKAEYRN